jgi:hypothetical protein
LFCVFFSVIKEKRLLVVIGVLKKNEKDEENKNANSLKIIFFVI